MQISDSYNNSTLEGAPQVLSREDAVKYTEASVRDGLSDPNAIKLIRSTVSKYGGFGEGLAVSMASNSVIINYAVESSIDDINEVFDKSGRENLSVPEIDRGMNDIVNNSSKYEVLREARDDGFSKLTEEQQAMSKAGLDSSIADAIPSIQEQDNSRELYAGTGVNANVDPVVSVLGR